MTKTHPMPERRGSGARAVARKPAFKKALTLKQQVALFYARKRRKARASS